MPSGGAALTSTEHSDAACRILTRLMHGFVGNMGIRLWDDRTVALAPGAAHQQPSFTLIVRDPDLLRRLIVTRSPLLLADAYFRGQLDVEGDFYSALALKGHFERLALPFRQKLAMLFDAWKMPTRDEDSASEPIGARLVDRFGGRHTRASDRDAIAFHYDVSNAFYGLWLDSERVYSCAYFEDETDSLDAAQRNKLELICRKLRLKPGDRLLDIGCGWGALVCWAARHHGVHAHGITLSQSQLDFARQRIRDEGLEDKVTVELRDYRDVEGEAVYDKVSSIGMFEHVGLANMANYLAVVQRVLRPGGLFLNHGITHDEEGWNRTVATEFINRYVFPDGEFDCVSNIQLGMERGGFEIEDVEAMRRHYALTLRHWVARLEDNSEAALREVDEPTYRVWRLYMAACALEFEEGGTGIYQILATRRGAASSLPLSRADLCQPLALLDHAPMTPRRPGAPPD